jgi:hypothetical protein
LLARGHIKMLNIHLWTKDQLHSSEVHSIEGGQLLARGHIKMLNILEPKDQLHSSEVHSEEASCWQEDNKMLNIHFGPKISCIVVRCIVLREASCWQEDTLKC